MGGNAIKNAFTRRYSKKEYNAIVPDIIAKVKTKFNDATDTNYFKDKESFGDADILVLVDKPIDFNITDWIYEEFQSKEVVQNTHVYSFEYNELQVDLILTPEKNWETSKIYFSYNDLHNLIGKVAHKFHLKWGYQGLVFVYRIDGKKLGDIVVSRNHNIVLPFLGFDIDRYDQGFNNLDEIFDFVTESKYFNPWMFDFETLNRINRERDQKRTTYASFVKHVAPMKEIGKDAYHYFYHDKKVYIGLIDHYFPGFLKEYRKLEKKEEHKRNVHALFNGKLIMDKYKITGKSLGEAISKFKNYFDSTELFEEYILETNDSSEILLKFAQINNIN